MLKPKTRQTDKEGPNPGLAAAGANSALEDITALLERHKEALSTEFKSSFETFATKLANIEASIVVHGDRITSLEDNAGAVEQRLTDVEKQCSALKKDNDPLRSKVADLEGRSRRSNIRLVGLPENMEGPRPSVFFSQLLSDVFGPDILPTPPEIDRAHRVPGAKPLRGAKPRPVILCLHRFQVKDLIIREARKRKDLSYKEHAIRLYDDYSPDVLKLRNEYRAAMPELYERGYRLSLLFPAKLRITLPDGEKKWFASAAAAEKFVQDRRNIS
uniref:Transposase element L1Md-A101/L1Md-A102/L1Md-A2 n=1 Tax=Oryzias sinensis TaxID=183150 RepID=A0A8C7XBI8_9TELE